MPWKKNRDRILIWFLLSAFTISYSESLVFPPYLHSYGIRKATPKQLFLFFGFKTTFCDPQGLATTRLNSWDNPKTEKDDDEVIVYGINSGHHEIIYNTSMWSLALYGGKGSGEGKFLFPKGVAADPDGNVFVADSGNNRIVHLFNPKSDLQWKEAFTGKSPGEKGLLGPSRVAVDEEKMVYATDCGNRRIVVFSYNGKVMRHIPDEKQEYHFSDGPTALAVADGANRWSYFKSERVVFCADSFGTRVWKISAEGKLLKQVRLPTGYHASYGSIDYYHNYWVTDTYNHCILKFDHDLELLDIFGSYGTGDNQFVEPRGITIYKRYGQVFIAEKKGAQYYWIGTQLKSAGLKDDGPGRFALTVKATEYSFLSLFTKNAADTVYYLKRYMAFPGSSIVRIRDREPAASGKNDFTLKIEPTYSSYTYNKWFYQIKKNEKEIDSWGLEKKK